MADRAGGASDLHETGTDVHVHSVSTLQSRGRIDSSHHQVQHGLTRTSCQRVCEDRDALPSIDVQL